MKLQVRFKKLLFMFVTTTNIKEGRLYLASSTSKAKFAEGVFQNHFP